MTEQAFSEGGIPGDVLAELSRVLLSQETLDSVLHRVAHLAKRTIPAADEVSVTLVRSTRPTTAAYTGELAVQADERQYGLDQGPCLDAARGGEMFYVEDMRREDRWRDYPALAVEAGVGSSVSIPLPVQQEVLGALNVYSRSPHAFDETGIDSARAFASFAAIAVANADMYLSTAELATQMEQAMATRATIEQAKGILMAQRRCSAEDAFDLLVRASQRENTKLRDLARRVVEGTQSRGRPGDDAGAANAPLVDRSGDGRRRGGGVGGPVDPRRVPDG